VGDEGHLAMFSFDAVEDGEKTQETFD